MHAATSVLSVCLQSRLLCKCCSATSSASTLEGESYGASKRLRVIGESPAYHTMWKDGRGEVGVRVVTGSDSQHGLVCSLHDALQILQGTLHLQRQIITQRILYREASAVFCITIIHVFFVE